ncbi:MULTISPECIES: carbohydrate ABC transporter permease [Streptomyces]|uniref:Sugar ABC transporter permease n=1 Tax=Streptomyces tsukubensis (strain DSM 42081 / NBRC 108919 / NRRL 18488 / 9993) TaxID=1114943 RepID=I2N5W8_STRT9|nr:MULTISPECIES: sugar ABC transporter permease [Streptomyces]AZK98606.1 sugar ABC transporter permease [Streptomyces tsukubensis]EIF92415.1 sugar transporter integral membrane protein [Streptomyces tsukubensis NRRL18488]MYS67767.1 ABC transporter permease subunit [Streptomyces sp. SID5473]QKM67576.1 sugar ABC transporter permease [Streptomyces tsukubensis NRRL18488]TAI43970.1 sugar ABC transporter permease [Streptomyces tsukubensis]
MTVQTERAPSGPAEASEPPVKGKGRPSAPRKAGDFVPYLLLLPAVAATLVFLGWPLVNNAILSFQNLNMRQLIQRLTEWNGIDNYRDILTGPDFWRVTGRSIVFAGVNVLLIMVLGTLVGLLLARIGKKMRVTLMVALVLAWAMPVVASSTVYQWLFAQRFGVINWVLVQLGFEGMASHNWFGTQFSTFFVVTLLIVWQSIPFVALSLYAATTTIPKELYEAAALDGANAWRSFTSVTMPFLRPFLYATTFLEIIWVFKAFVQVYTINAGGPDRLTEILPVYAYIEGIGNQHYGMGSAIAMLTIVIMLLLTAYYLRIVLKQEEDQR